MYYNRRKQIIKSGIIITFILAVAVISTHHIYYKFKSERDVLYNSGSLDIIFHEKSGDKVTLTRLTPVTDSVGLSSKEYNFTIKNNINNKITYNIKLSDDKKSILADECGEYLIPKDIIKISIKEEKNKDKIYILSNLEENILKTDSLKGLEEKTYTIRVWAGSNTLTTGSNLHYHGKIKVEEEK